MSLLIVDRTHGTTHDCIAVFIHVTNGCYYSLTFVVKQLKRDLPCYSVQNCDNCVLSFEF